MIRRTSLVLAVAAVASASAFAGGAVSSTSGASVSSGTGLIVSQGASSSTVSAPAGSVAAAPGSRLLPGAAQVQASQTSVMGGPAPGVSSTTTITTNYWVNVPAGVERRGDFQRWRNLR